MAINQGDAAAGTGLAGAIYIAIDGFLTATFGILYTAALGADALYAVSDGIAAAIVTDVEPDLASGIPTGGTVGQLLEKLSATDYDLAWTSPAAFPTTLPALTDVTITAAQPEDRLVWTGAVWANQARAAVIEDLETLGAATADNQFIVATAAGVFAYESSNTARDSLGLGSTSSPTFSTLGITGTLYITERASALSNVAGRGQLWVRSDIPNTLMFANDAGQEAEVGVFGFLAAAGDFLVATGPGAYQLESGATARASLGIALGTDAQDWDADLDALAALAGTGVAVRTAASTWATRTIAGGDGVTVTNGDGVAGNPSVAVDADVLRDADVGVQLQAYGAALDVLAALPFTADGEFLVGTAAGAAVLESGATARTSLGLGAADSPDFAAVQLGYVLMDERAAQPTTAAGEGTYWVRDDIPTVPIFTDDGGTDRRLAYYDTPIAGIAVTDGQFLVGSGGGWTLESLNTARTSLALGNDSAVTHRHLTLSHSTDPKLTLVEDGSAGMEIYDATANFGVIRKLATTGTANLQFNAVTQDGTSITAINFHPNASTTGEVRTYIYDGAGGIQHRIKSNGANSAFHLLSGQMSIGYGTNREMLDVNGGVALDYAIIDEQTTAPTTTAGEGVFWVKDDIPNAPMFTDDAGTDFTIAYLDGVLEDLDTLGAPSADGEFIVATAAGVFTYESGDTARTSLGLGTGDSPTWTGVAVSGTGGIELAESGTPPAPGAGVGVYWVENTAATIPKFTDDASVDHTIVLAAYHSELITTSSTASAAKYDVFDEDNYGAYTSTELVSEGITYTATDGRFTILRAGTYAISVSWITEISLSGLVDFSIELSGAAQYTAQRMVNTAGDPLCTAAQIILTVTANQYVNVFVDSVSTGTVTTHEGTAISIHRVG